VREIAASGNLLVPMSRFADRLAPNLGHPLEAACAVRPPGTPIAAGIGASIGAAIGSIGGGSALAAGLGGGLGVIVAYVVLWLRLRGKDVSLTMALVLTAERLELYRLGMFSATRPRGLIRGIAYADVAAVQERPRVFELVVTVLSDGGNLEFATAKRGGGAETVEHLRRRIAA
jgi:hypothetical protein